MLGRESNRRGQSIGGKILLPRFVSRLYMAKNRLEYLTRKDRAYGSTGGTRSRSGRARSLFWAGFLAGPAGQDGPAFGKRRCPDRKILPDPGGTPRPGEISGEMAFLENGVPAPPSRRTRTSAKVSGTSGNHPAVARGWEKCATRLPLIRRSAAS